MKRICSIYRSSKKNEMYLYVLKSDALERVPEPLMAAFGKAIHAFDLVLSPERELSGKTSTKCWKTSTPRAITCRCHRPKTNTSSICPKSCCAVTTRSDGIGGACPGRFLKNGMIY